MTGRDTTQGDGLLGDRVRRLDALCDRFEADWAAGREPRIEEYLIGVNEADRGAAFLELLERVMNSSQRAVPLCGASGS